MDFAELQFRVRARRWRCFITELLEKIFTIFFLTFLFHSPQQFNTRYYVFM